MPHYTEDDLTLYYYGEGRRRAEIDKHLSDCRACAAVYRSIAGTLAMIAVPDAPERGDQYGLEVWQRIRHRLPEQDDSAWSSPRNVFSGFRFDRLAVLAAAAAVVLAAFVAGRIWPSRPTEPPPRWRSRPPRRRATSAIASCSRRSPIISIGRAASSATS